MPEVALLPRRRHRAVGVPALGDVLESESAEEVAAMVSVAKVVGPPCCQR